MESLTKKFPTVLIDSTDNEGYTALMHGKYSKEDKKGPIKDFYCLACKNFVKPYEIENIVKLLLEKGADPNVISKDGSTPLIIGIYHDYKIFSLKFDYFQLVIILII